MFNKERKQMSNKCRISILMIVLIIAMIMIRPEKNQEDKITHQHKTWQQEKKSEEGFDEKGVLTTHLPIIVLKTKGKEIPGMDRQDNRRLLFDYEIIRNRKGLNRSDDEPDQSGKAQLSIRGNSSRDFPKKQYLFKTVNESGEAKNEKILGLPSHSTWTLNGSYIDYSQLRNYIAYSIADEIMGYVPKCRLCEVMMQNEKGELEYQGLYTFSEKPKVAKNRLKLTEYNPKHERTSFLLQMNSPIEKLQVDHLLVTGTLTKPYDLEYPKVEELTQQSFLYIQNEVYLLEKALFDASVHGDWEEVEKKIDMDSFVDYYLINEFLQNYDAGRRSTYMHKDLGGTFQMGPIWDFDGAFNNYMDVNIPKYDLKMKRQHYYYYLMQDPHFAKECVERYKELRSGVLSEEHLLEYIDESSNYLGDAALRNCDRWYEGDYSKYYDDLEKMKQFVIERGRWMDENFEKVCTVIE